MYDKNLNKCVRLRLSEDDFNFIVGLSDQLQISVSETIRLIIKSQKFINREDAVHGNTKTNFNDIF